MFILDTNVISEMTRPKPNPRVLEWLDRVAIEHQFITSITLSELLFGIAKMDPGARQRALRDVTNAFLALFSKRVLAFDEEAARLHADMAATARHRGATLSTKDGYIAAIAASRDYTVVTRNTSDFVAASIKLTNP